MKPTTKSFSKALLKETWKQAGGKKLGIKLEPELRERNKAVNLWLEEGSSNLSFTIGGANTVAHLIQVKCTV